MAKLQQLTIRIAKLWGQPQGTTEKHEIDEKISYPDESLDFAGNFIADLMLIKLKDEISAILTDAQIPVNFTCQLCLKKFQQSIQIPSTEREFYFHPPHPKEVQDESDIYMIDKKMMTIDLKEMVRQEIILHFPIIPVCSKSCKGLCPVCGKNRNKIKCLCREETSSDTYKPFQNLKNLMS